MLYQSAAATASMLLPVSQKNHHLPADALLNS
jgi:hypothetical protein